jgi:protein FRA10AC1
LKHYKSGNVGLPLLVKPYLCSPTVIQFALRWRTESEVLSGAGESTCGNTRCEHHHLTRVPGEMMSLSTLELPFGYEERGKQKSALVKVVLCNRCVKKLMWKRRKEKEGVEGLGQSAGELRTHRKPGPDNSVEHVDRERDASGSDVRNHDISQGTTKKKRRRSSRSLSPRSRRKRDGSTHVSARLSDHRSITPL